MFTLLLGTGKNTHSKIIAAAKKRKDIDMVSKLAGYEDLFAYDAKYHKNCYCQYISDRNIVAYQNKSTTDKTLQKLKSHHSDSSDTISSISESSSINLNDHSIKNTEENEILILHKAAGILKNKIRKFKTLQRYFPIPDDMNQANFEKQVPNELLKFVSWLIDDDCYENVHDQIIPKAAIPCNIIMSLYDNNTYRKNNFQIGLGIYVYHLVRSQKILDILSTIGLSCTYNDLRQLTTSLAKKKHFD